jgi:hypothetical protein
MNTVTDANSAIINGTTADLANRLHSITGNQF